MKFVKLDEQQFRFFLDQHPQRTFLQTPEIGLLRQKNNWDIHYLGVENDGVIVAASMFLSKKNFLGKKEFYAPRGFLIDYNDPKLLAFYTQEIKNYIQQNDGYILRIDPYVFNKERDINGDVVDGGFDNSKVIDYLLQLGFKKSLISEQVKWMFAIDLVSKSKEEVLKSMHANTRNIIRNTIKNNVLVRELSYDELTVFKKITDETSKRRNFSDRSLEYYQNMYNLYHEKKQVKFLLSYINLDDYITILASDKNDKEISKAKLVDNASNAGKLKELNITIASLSKKIAEATQTRQENGNELLLSVGMFILYSPEVIYLISGNRNQFMSYGGQYRIQWEMIQYAIDNKFEKYNFYGIMDVFDPKHKDYGIYQFKRGFNGSVYELIGEFELAISWQYKLKKIIDVILKTIRRLK